MLHIEVDSRLQPIGPEPGSASGANRVLPPACCLEPFAIRLPGLREGLLATLAGRPFSVVAAGDPVVFAGGIASPGRFLLPVIAAFSPIGRGRDNTLDALCLHFPQHLYAMTYSDFPHTVSARAL